MPLLLMADLCMDPFDFGLVPLHSTMLLDMFHFGLLTICIVIQIFNM